MKYKADFFADGKFRVFDNSMTGSSFLHEGLFSTGSCHSLPWLRSMNDFKLLSRITVGDMFCGAGIGAIGAKQLGLIVSFAFDNNKHAVRNYNNNIKDIAVVADAKTLDINSLPYADILTGGFPCQPFSVGGKGLGESDPCKGNLGKVSCEIINSVNPKAFLLENVKGLTHKKNMPFFNKLIEILSDNYNVTHEIVDCSEYGVPQKRERVFIVGIRKDLNKKFIFPGKTHLKNKITIEDAIGDIKIKDEMGYLLNHQEDCGIRNDEAPYVNKIPVGGNWKDLCIDDQKSFMKKGFYSGGGRTGCLHKVNPNKPAKTILSSPMGKATAQILHWKGQEARRYTVRESLRLQTVPDSFYFDADTPLMKQYERCSGIPTLVSYILLNEIKNIIKETI
tara:strand:+ start:940 stop:2118 length:1179 start_codon:yes stop_codon:yes gene_type:complete